MARNGHKAKLVRMKHIVTIGSYSLNKKNSTSGFAANTWPAVAGRTAKRGVSMTASREISCWNTGGNSGPPVSFFSVRAWLPLSIAFVCNGCAPVCPSFSLIQEYRASIRELLTAVAWLIVLA